MAAVMDTATLCYHCQSPVPPGCDIRCSTDSGEQPLCCMSCLAAVQFIHELKLDNYYQYREQCDAANTPAGQPALADSNDLEAAVTVLSDGRQ